MAWKSPVVPWDQCSEERRADLRVIWSRGALAYKLHPDQKAVYDLIRASWGKVKSSLERVFVLDISRQWGKDFLTCVILVETLYTYALAEKAARIPYGAPTRDEIKELLVPTLEEVFTDCPPEMLPREMRDGSFTRSANALTLPSGKQRLVLVGCDLHPKRMRGPASAAFAFTEAGFMDIETNLGIVQPQLLTKPDGFGLLVSTPPDTPAHDFDTITLPRAKAAGMCVKRTIYDNPSLTEDQIKGAIRALGGERAEKCRRELFGEHIANLDRLVIPEWKDVRGVDTIDGSYSGGCVVAREPPKYRDCYVAMDPGWSDLCAVLFAYWDFERAVLVIEDCFALPQANSAIVAEEIRKRESALWVNVEAWSGGRMQSQPYKRVSDTDLRMIGDMTAIHGLRFAPTRKDDRDAAINALRVRVSEGKIEIHPRCKELIAHLDHAIWNKSRREFERSGKWGHFDCVAALVYLDRNIDRHRNPFPPALYGVDTSGMFVPAELRTPAKDPITNMFPKAAARYEAIQRARQARRI